MVKRNREPGHPDEWAGHREPRNRLLELLPQQDWATIEPMLERVELHALETVEPPGKVSPWLFFPESAIISVVNALETGQRVEVGTVGIEGMYGLSAWHEAGFDENDAVCSVGGTALRGRASEILVVADRQPELRRLVNRYAAAYITLVSQGNACNRVHGIEERCARWLLLAHDRRRARLMVTRDLVAIALGTPPDGAAMAIDSLRQHGFITATHEYIDVVDRVGLERKSCECYRVVRDRFETLG